MAAPQPIDFKHRATLSRTEIAARLHNLADQIAQGRLSFDQGEALVGEQIAYELEFETEHRKSELTIELEWH